MRSARSRGFTGARERFDELTAREMDARLVAKLRDYGKYDRVKHGALRDEPLTPAEHLELIATGEVLARRFPHHTMLDHAVKAGATWEQIGAARGTSAERARADYREWATGQHDMWAATGVWTGTTAHRMGMPDAEYAEALARLADLQARQ